MLHGGLLLFDACIVLYFVLKGIKACRATSKCIGFFHPYCNAGGGGERVLWVAIASLQQSHPDLPIVVYTGDVDVAKQAVLAKAKVLHSAGMPLAQTAQDRFGIVLKAETIDFVYLKNRWLVEESTWPRFTLLGQSLGSVLLALEALYKCTPSIFIDTMGYAFTYPLVRLLTSSPILSYTHYPTISPDMILRVQQRQAGHTNPARVASSRVLSAGKLLYYKLFAEAYRFCLLCAEGLLVNSTWTQNKICSLLGAAGSHVRILYPPCDVKSLASVPLQPRKPLIFSLAQFRPEKEHANQIKAMASFCARFPKESKDARLVLAGSVRNQADLERVEGLKALVRSLDLEVGSIQLCDLLLTLRKDRVEFVVNAPYWDLMAYFRTASVGLSTMVDEHFGINIVELMAAGIIVIAHPSAGPLFDIVVPFHDKPTGYHAGTPEEFATRLQEVFSLSSHEQEAVRANARASVLERFSEELFVQGFLEAFDTLHYSS